MESLGTWWSELSVILKLYWALAIPFTLFFVLQLVLSFLGQDSPDDLPDSEIQADHGIGFQFFTLKNMVGFFTIFGWVGIASIASGASVASSLVFAVIGGVAMMGIMAGTFYLLMKANSDGTMKIERAIGQTGEVYLTIKSKRGASGKVQIKVMGALRTLDALTDDETDIQTGRTVRVSDVVHGTTLLVTSN
jgi:membrane protein implicated in regulation of membrane protease activity